MNKNASIINAFLKNFHKYLHSKGLRHTPQRQLIVDTFLNSVGHLTMEELYQFVKKEDSSIGQATVYRTMKLLCKAGVAKEMRFNDGVARYENMFNEHHDHIICDLCGVKLEFFDGGIEKLQEKLIRRRGFIPTYHRLYLYGICPECQNS